MSSRRLRFARARGVSCGDDLRAFFSPKSMEGTKSKIKTLNKTLNKSDALVFFSHSHPPHKTSLVVVSREKKKMAEQGPKVGDARSLWNFTPSPGTRFCFCLFVRFVLFGRDPFLARSFKRCVYTRCCCILKIFEICFFPNTRTRFGVFLFPARFCCAFVFRPSVR
jgi:hypothetical protein